MTTPLVDYLPTNFSWRWLITGSTIFAAGAICQAILTRPLRQAQIIPSPRKTLLPKLTKEELNRLSYAPDSFPGARDVETPYGSIRVYEFGPETGRKVLLIHGISTPCLALGALANGLASKGCRVMLFDLFGRGFSDMPYGVAQDVRLFTTQILLAISSSPLPWTGDSAFSLIGYSLGGGIAANFTAHFPSLVSSLVLIAPAGLIRERHISNTSRLLYRYSDGIIPEPIINYLVKRRLRTPIAKPSQTEHTTTTAEDAVSAEMPPPSIEANSTAPMSKAHPDATVQSAVEYQVENHQGFVHAFMSSIRYGPIQKQHEDWRTIGSRLSEKNLKVGKMGTTEKVLILGGEKDNIIVMDELMEDATEVLGKGNVEFAFFDASHDVAVVRSKELVERIDRFFGEQDGVKRD